MAKPLLLVVCGALVVAGVQWGPSATPAGTSEPPDAPTVAPTEDETLQNEADNQENVLSQVVCGPWSPPPQAPGPLRPDSGGDSSAEGRGPPPGVMGSFQVTESGERREGRQDSTQLLEKEGLRKKNHNPNL